MIVGARELLPAWLPGKIDRSALVLLGKQPAVVDKKE